MIFRIDKRNENNINKCSLNKYIFKIIIRIFIEQLKKFFIYKRFCQFYVIFINIFKYRISQCNYNNNKVSKLEIKLIRLERQFVPS